MRLSERLQQLIEQFGPDSGPAAGDSRCLAVTFGADAGDQRERLEHAAEFDWVSDPRAVGDLAIASTYGLAIVLLDSEQTDSRLVGHLLGRLRDGGAKRTLVDDPHTLFEANELLALGYVAREASAAVARPFVHDPDEYFARREWNSPEDWANPENFGRYRW